MTNATTRKRAIEGRELVLNAALECIVERGYHGTSIRDIAARTGTTSAAMYYHFASKQEILSALMDRALSEALAATRTALDSAGADPSDRLSSATHAWVLFHAERRQEALVGATEIRSLTEDNRATVVSRRDEQEQLFRDVVEQGCSTGRFHVARPEIASRAIITMGTAVATWFQPDGALSPEDVAIEYSTLALGLVRATE